MAVKDIEDHLAIFCISGNLDVESSEGEVTTENENVFESHVGF